MCLFSLLSQFLFFVYGTMRPAWHTYKTLNSGDEEFLAWAKYWIVYAFLITFEVLADVFLSWLPLYMPTKLILVLWIVLSAPSANVWMFDAILRPVLTRRQEQIDHFLNRGKDKLLSDALSSMTQLVARSQLLPFVAKLWSRSSPTPLMSANLMQDVTGEGIGGRPSEDTDSATASVQNLSSASSPVGSLENLHVDSEEIQVGASKATTHLQPNKSQTDLAKKNFLSPESQRVFNRRAQRKFKTEMGISSATKLEYLHDDVEDLLVKSRIETSGQEVRQQRQPISRRRL
ncbi:receptor expression-enhancing protein 1 [Drosophila teissieri]|uniref:receptor expression-enhancing protein 1 n=1 Tax=Drosophila teissieri TaxID=7243 RepID=UPI001CBA49CE|nr:receptor expression-enhancing protein 1 [Drosophila teissieri]